MAMEKKPKDDGHDSDCKTCSDILRDKDNYLRKQCEQKFNYLPRTDCDCPDSNAKDEGGYHYECVPATLPDLNPIISVKWGDSKCDGFETDDFEVLCITVCNSYCNVTFNDFTITHIKITDMAGNPVPCLPDGTPSVQVVPSGPICFGDIGPCEHDRPSCISREFAVNTCGAIGQCYLLTFEGVCFTVSYELQSKHCFVVKLCQD
jgi:hypothetical protein